MDGSGVEYGYPKVVVRSRRCLICDLCDLWGLGGGRDALERAIHTYQPSSIQASTQHTKLTNPPRPF